MPAVTGQGAWRAVVAGHDQYIRVERQGLIQLRTQQLDFGDLPIEVAVFAASSSVGPSFSRGSHPQAIGHDKQHLRVGGNVQLPNELLRCHDAESKETEASRETLPRPCNRRAAGSAEGVDRFLTTFLQPKLAAWH